LVVASGRIWHRDRSAWLIEQLSLEFEELEASATEDELAAEQAVDDERMRLHPPARRARHVLRPSAARAGGDRSSEDLRMLRRQSPAQKSSIARRLGEVRLV
jgi:hypothetical protein